ncbi:hypothetical protein HQ533_03135 [Candidatus Woesearchaeota archaeon]|nr:hypothetical protein [Candidatus Woesearchaeota archaeon]
MEYSLRDGKGTKAHSFKEFNLLDGTIMGVFQGSRGENPDLDIIIKYQEPNKRVRTPKHIHWVIDILIKKEHNRELSLDFVRYLRDMWEKVEPFRTKEEQQKCQLKQTTPKKLREFDELNKYGEYTIEFIGHLIELMMRMEKTGLARAFVFKNLMDSILNEEDIFVIVGKATQNG